MGAPSPFLITSYRLPQAERARYGGSAVRVEVRAQAANQPRQFRASLLPEQKCPALRDQRSAGAPRTRAQYASASPRPSW